MNEGDIFPDLPCKTGVYLNFEMICRAIRLKTKSSGKLVGLNEPVRRFSANDIDNKITLLLY
jgi:hypothetical protein